MRCVVRHLSKRMMREQISQQCPTFTGGQTTLGKKKGAGDVLRLAEKQCTCETMQEKRQDMVNKKEKIAKTQCETERTICVVVIFFCCFCFAFGCFFLETIFYCISGSGWKR